MFAVDAFVQQGTLYIYGTNNNDQIDVRFANNQIEIQGVQIKNASGKMVDRVSRSEVPYQVIATGQGGDDRIAMIEAGDTALPAILFGNQGNDTLIGGSKDDTLVGQEGIDRLYGNGGNDKLIAALYGTSQDAPQNNTVSELLFGGNGNDLLYGSPGADQISGGAGNDTLNGLGGNDLLGGLYFDGTETGNDTIDGGDGNDTIWAGAGQDRALGNAGDDTIYGEGDNDVLGGAFFNGMETGNDKIYGGSGADSIWGGEGVDRLVGDEGSDTIYGEGGADTLIGNVNDIRDEPSRDFLYGGYGDDTISGGGGDDYLVGDEGNDKIYGNSGNDTLYGSDGNDKLFGGEGVDRLFGGLMNDFLDAGSSWERDVFGEDGQDVNAFVTAVNGARAEDVFQGNSPTCWVGAAIAAVANSGVNLASRIRYIGGENYAVDLWQSIANVGARMVTTIVRFDGSLIANVNGGTSDYLPHQTAEGETWATIIARAYLTSRGINLANPPGGGTSDVLFALTGRNSGSVGYRAIPGTGDNLHDPICTSLTIQDRNALVNALRNRQAVTANTEDYATEVTPGVVIDHWYAVVNVYDAGIGGGWLVEVRNPWGTGGELKNGVTTMRWDDFARSFRGLTIA